MSRSVNAEPVKIVFINTQYVETDATSFKSVVQRLTGKDSAVVAEPKARRESQAAMVVASGGGRGGGGSGSGSSVLSRGVSFKDVDRLFLELPLLDELHRLCADGI
ncbi:hypothetical protein U1Q18_024334 [Sarracenia purpurea var. burkii]